MTYLGTVIDVTSKLAIRLMPTRMLDVDDFVKWRDAEEETRQGQIRFTNIANNDALKDAEIYSHYNVWKFPTNARVVLSASNNQVATKRMVQAVQHVEEEVATGNAFFKLLLGYADQGTMEQRIKALSQKSLPQIDVESEVQLLQTEVQDTFGKTMNDAQLTALRKALTSSLCLIQGCPGSGKTFLAAVIIKGLGRMYNDGKTAPGKHQILCCAGSNVAADNIALYCLKAKLSVLRVYARSMDENNFKKLPEVQSISLNQIIMNNLNDETYVKQGIVSKNDNDMLKIYATSPTLDVFGNMNVAGKIEGLFQKIEMMEIGNAQIVVCTCITAGDDRFRNRCFDAVVIDEASQLIEPEQMVAMVRTNKHAIIIGDQNQLGPCSIVQELVPTKADRSFYVRMLSLGIVPVQLNIQYRMHPGLLEFPNRTFYYSRIKSGIRGEDRALVPKIPKPVLSTFMKSDYPCCCFNV